MQLKADVSCKTQMAGLPHLRPWRPSAAAGLVLQRRAQEWPEAVGCWATHSPSHQRRGNDTCRLPAHTPFHLRIAKCAGLPEGVLSDGRRDAVPVVRDVNTRPHPGPKTLDPA